MPAVNNRGFFGSALGASYASLCPPDQTQDFFTLGRMPVARPFLQYVDIAARANVTS